MTPEIELIRAALRFADWAAGEGICPADGEGAEVPEDFLMAYSVATGDEDWETLAERLTAALAQQEEGCVRLREALLAKLDNWAAVLGQIIGFASGPLFDALYGDQPDSAPASITVPLGDLRRLRALLAKEKADE